MQPARRFRSPSRPHRSLQSCRSACALYPCVVVSRGPVAPKRSAGEAGEGRWNRGNTAVVVAAHVPLVRGIHRGDTATSPLPTSTLRALMLLTLSAVLYALATSAGHAAAGKDSLMGPGVSRALASARVAQIRDVRYRLGLDVTRGDSAIGSVVARFRLTRPGDVILDFRGQRLGKVEVNGLSLAIVDYNGAHVRIPA